MIQIPNSDIVIPLWPCYHMPSNPQVTLSQNATKHYNKFRSVLTEHLIYIKFVNHAGIKAKVHTIPQYIKKKLLDCIPINILHPTAIIPLPKNEHHPMIVNATSFNKSIHINRTLVHRRIMHISHKTIDIMCKEGTIKDIPKHLPPIHDSACICIIC